MYKFETKTDADGVINQVVNHKPNGFNPTTGVYSSNYIFQGDWQDELDALTFFDRGEGPKEVWKIYAWNCNRIH